MFNSRSKIYLEPLQEPLMLPLWARAVETGRSRPIIEDPYAVQFISHIEYDFTGIEKKYAPVQPLWPIRAHTIDRVLRDFIAAHPQATVVNLGAGLDTTFFRVDNGKIRWYDLDLPEVIALRRQFVRETGRLRFIADSAWNDIWLDRLPYPDGGLFFVAAGLLMYFEESQVRALLTKIADRFPAAEMMLDFISPRFVKRNNGKYKWGIEDAHALPDIDPRIVVLRQWRYYNQFPHRWNLAFRLLRPFIIKWNGMAHIGFSARPDTESGDEAPT